MPIIVLQQKRIDEIEVFIIKKMPDYQKVEYDDLNNYFDGPAPSGDEITLNDIFANKWLLIHELVEINFLKKLGYEISAKLLITNPLEVDSAHISATELELEFANEANDVEWMKTRLVDVEGWARDTSMCEDLRKRCFNLMNKYESRLVS